MTEEEAKTKWCPMARVLDGQPGNGEACATAVNRQGPETNLNCIGSSCAMWRELRGLAETQGYSQEEISNAMNGSGFHLPVIGGYCGLAGKP